MHKFLKKVTSLTFFASLFLCESSVSSEPLTPIARTDVIPHQRITKGSTLNFGVVAFSKARIDRVEFQISGCGYSGETKVAQEMLLNPQTNVWEYWVPISANEFPNSGEIIVEASVFGKDGGFRHSSDKDGDGLDPISLVVDSENKLPEIQVWVASSGSDSQGEVSNPKRPYQTLAAALDAVKVAMQIATREPSLDGAIIHLAPGTYKLDGGEKNLFSTKSEWLTITSDPQHAGSPENTIIDGVVNDINTSLIRFHAVQLKSHSKWGYVVRKTPHTEKCWVSNCILEGPGRYAEGFENGGGNPVTHGNVWITDTKISRMGRGSVSGPLSRGCTISEISEDAFQNHPFIINATVYDVNPFDGKCEGRNCTHADVVQYHTKPKENCIVYGLYATDIHYQGIFSRHDTAANPAQLNMAFVNCLIEMREKDNGGTNMNNQWRHLVMWHNTFIGGKYVCGMNRDGSSEFLDSSIVGNVFTNWICGADNRELGQELGWTTPGNKNRNEFIHNHYFTSATDLDPLGRNCKKFNACEDTYFQSRSPDTQPDGIITQSLGKNVLDQSADSPLLGRPLTGSILIGRIDQSHFSTVPVDALGRNRGSHADVGAIEFRPDEVLPAFIQVESTK